MANPNPEEVTVTILLVGGAGGTIELCGVQDQTGWRFRVSTNEAALLDEEDAWRPPPRPWVRSWHEALDQLENYPWRRLVVLSVEPGFRAQILGAFFKANTLTPAVLDDLQNILHQWAILLAPDGRCDRNGADPSRTVGEHPTEGGSVVAKKGGHGPYVSHNGIYAKIPDDKTPETITLEEAITLLGARAAQLGGSGNRIVE